MVRRGQNHFVFCSYTACEHWLLRTAEDRSLGWTATVPYATSLCLKKKKKRESEFILGTQYGKYIKHLTL